MTVLLTLEHHKLTDVVTVDPRAAAVGESSIELAPRRADDRAATCSKGALIQSANDAADALALSIAPDYPAFARLMNAKAAQLGLRDTHFVRPDGLDAPGEYSSAADVTKLARLVMRTRVRARRPCARRPRRSPAGARCTRGTTCSSQFPQTIGVKTGHTDARGLVPGRRRARARRDDLRDAARLARRARERNDDLRVAARSGGSRSSASSRRCSRGATYADVALPVRPGAARRSSRRSRCSPSRGSAGR